VEEMEPAARAPLLLALLTDPVRTVRIDAAKVLAGVPRDALPPDQRAAFEAALEEYRGSQRVNADRDEAHLNLGVLGLRMGEPDDAERVLRKGLEMGPRSADLCHALGLLLVRQKRLPEALQSHQRAIELAPDQVQYAYGVGLQSTGQVDRAMKVLREAHRRHPGDGEILMALATFSRDRGQFAEAQEYARMLAALFPDDPEVRGLLEELKARAGQTGPR